MRKATFLMCWLGPLWLLCSTATAQNILLDHPLKCGPLQCFPSASNETEFYYLPNNPHIAKNAEGTHEFSFTRYVEAIKNSDGSGGIKTADGGGIVHFLVDYGVSAEARREAEEALQEDNEDAVLRGPIVFTQGTFALVSAVAGEGEDELSHRVLGVGKAPLLEGLKTAVSMHLSKKGAQLLWESFAMQTPDVSLVFEMSFTGLNDPANARITADWAKLEKQADLSLGAKVGYMGIGAGFDYGDFWHQAQQSGAITIDYRGDPDKLQSLIDKAHAKLHDMMFEPIEITQATGGSDDDLLDTMQAVTRGLGQNPGASYSAPWEVKLSGGYKRRNLQQTGQFTLDFTQRTQATLTTVMAGNAGNMKALYGDDERVFKTVNLSLDNRFKVREIHFALDARDENEFAKYINQVSVQLMKEHGSGAASSGELIINRSNFQSGSPQILSYGWDEEPDVDAWLKFKHKATWSFVGGSTFDTGWIEGDTGAISLTPPYQYREIEFIADPQLLEEANVRMVTVRVSHDFFGRRVRENINLVPMRNELSAQRFFAIPPGDDGIDYVITWTRKDHSKVSSGPAHSTDSIIFCDEVPTGG